MPSVVRKNWEDGEPAPLAKKAKKTKKEKISDDLKLDDVPRKSTRGLYNEVKKAAYIRGCKIVEVTKENVKDVHAELTTGTLFKDLTKGRIMPAFMYDYLSSVNGRYLEGASKLQDEEPEEEEYDPTNESANFVWEALKVFVLRRETKNKPICGIVIFHRAYLQQFPGPDEAHHVVDPVMMAENKNIASEVGYTGSKTWVDMPIIAGPGYGDILIGIVMAESKSFNIMVNIAAGKANTPMVKLLKRWYFKKLKVIHPETLEIWQDEDGYGVIMRYRKKAVTAKKAHDIFETFPLPKSLLQRREKKFIASKMRGEDKETIEKLKSDHKKELEKRAAQIEKAKQSLKKKDEQISKLKKQIKAGLSNSAFKKQFLIALKKSL
mmetsp:Transcript_46588/g.74906  ORF Transcript_46588/g.74906 Transcript_46588/m.74906 type:complete len:379 (-) Transcript_46588:358-1494(-)|eukprot:jgi/Bigna1/87655/estExt_fgenesh1_pg.C_220191